MNQPPQRFWIDPSQMEELHKLKDDLLRHYEPAPTALVHDERWYRVMEVIKMRRPDLAVAVDSLVQRRKMQRQNMAELFKLRDRVQHLEAALAPFAALELAGDAEENPQSIDPAIERARALLLTKTGNPG